MGLKICALTDFKDYEISVRVVRVKDTWLHS